MAKRTFGCLFMVLAVPLGFAHGQQDGACLVELTLPNDVVANIEDILFDTTSGFGPSEHAIASPFTTNSPVADGVIGDAEYPNTCRYTFADEENPGNPFPGLETVEDDDDLSLDLHLAHTDEFIFFGFEVTDEFLDVDEGVAAWNNDGVELFINADLEIGDEHDVTQEAFKVVGDIAGDGDLELNNRSGLMLFPVSEGPPAEDEFFSAGVPSESGWVLEFQIPLAGIDADSDDGATIEPIKTGDVMLINFAVNDVDVEGGDQGVGTHGMLWVVEDDPRSPQGGREEVWVTPLMLTEAVGEQKPALQPGDSDQDLDFDQLDLVKVQIAAKYLSGQAATWGDGDWNGAPGGEQGSPPAGNGFFDQLDIISALGAGFYLKGPYAALSPDPGFPGDEQTSLVYDPDTGELSVDAPAGKELTSLNVTSAGGKFVGDKPAALDGAFDNFAADNLFKATFGGSFGSISFGNVLPAQLSRDDVVADLSAVGSLAGGGDLGDVDLIYVPEPCAFILLALGLMSFAMRVRRVG